MKKETKILMGILLVIGLITSIGITVAHGTGESEDSRMRNMAEMMNSENMDMMNNANGDMPMMNGMMGNMQEMHEHMEEMMDNETLREEMLEHMKNCPMMKNSDSQIS